MSMSVGGGKKKGGGKRRSIADINVTPLVDVMLVLLIIFMITAPTMKEGFTVEIPQADATQSIQIQDAHMITVTTDGAVLKTGANSTDERYDKLSDLVKDLKAYKEECAKTQKPVVVVIVGDKGAKYERVIQVWNAARTAGIQQISFQVEPGNAPEPLTGPKTSSL